MLIVDEYFKDYPARKKVAQLLLDKGFSIQDSSIKANGIKIPITEVAKEADVNRKIVYHTIEQIQDNKALQLTFAHNKTRADLSEVAPTVGWEVLELKITDHSSLGEVLKIVDGQEIYEVLSKNKKSKIVIKEPLGMRKLKKVSSVKGIESLTLKTPEKNKEKLACNYCDIEYCTKKGETAT